jgi:hypothetical protein
MEIRRVIERHFGRSDGDVDLDLDLHAVVALNISSERDELGEVSDADEPDEPPGAAPAADAKPRG